MRGGSRIEMLERRLMLVADAALAAFADKLPARHGPPFRTRKLARKRKCARMPRGMFNSIFISMAK